MKSNNTEVFKTIMNPSTGKMVQSGGQLGKKIIKDYKAETIYNPLTGKHVKTGGSVGKKVLGMYKAKGGSTVDTSSNQEKNVYIYILFRYYIMLTPEHCKPVPYEFNKCKQTTSTGRKWYPTLINGLKKIETKYKAANESLQLDKIEKLNTETQFIEYWTTLQELYYDGEKTFTTKLNSDKPYPVQITYIVPINREEVTEPKTYEMKYTYKETTKDGTVNVETKLGQNQETRIIMTFYDEKQNEIMSQDLSEQDFKNGNEELTKYFKNTLSETLKTYNKIEFS